MNRITKPDLGFVFAASDHGGGHIRTAVAVTHADALGGDNRRMANTVGKVDGLHQHDPRVAPVGHRLEFEGESDLGIGLKGIDRFVVKVELGHRHAIGLGEVQVGVNRAKGCVISCFAECGIDDVGVEGASPGETLTLVVDDSYTNAL